MFSYLDINPAQSDLDLYIDIAYRVYKSTFLSQRRVVVRFTTYVDLVSCVDRLYGNGESHFFFSSFRFSMRCTRPFGRVLVNSITGIKQVLNLHLGMCGVFERFGELPNVLWVDGAFQLNLHWRSFKRSAFHSLTRISSLNAGTIYLLVLLEKVSNA